MNQNTRLLADLLRYLFNPAELRQFVRSLDDGRGLFELVPAGSLSIAELSEEVASLLERWGVGDADLIINLFERRPSRAREIMKFYRGRTGAATAHEVSLELVASIQRKAVGVYRLHPRQVKMIGRSSEAEIQFPITLVKLSREHAWVAWPSSGPLIQDLGAKNGMWINDRKVRRSPLRHGDTVQLGEVSLTVKEPNRTETSVPSDQDTLS